MKKQQNKKTTQEMQALYNEIIDETIDFICLIFFLRDLLGTEAPSVDADEFTEKLLQNEDLYDIYRSGNETKLREMIIGESFLFAVEFITRQMVEKEQKGGRH